MTFSQKAEYFDILARFINQFIHNTKDDALYELNNKFYDSFKSVIDTEKIHNAWFTPENVIKSLEGIYKLIRFEELAKIGSHYKISGKERIKKVGLIPAGNIPMVGFHDMLCVLLSGHQCICKFSSKDNRLFQSIIDILFAINFGFREYLTIVEGNLTGFDAVIATGSNNTSRYFDYYFGKVPHIFRKNRNSVAVISGKENITQIKNLADDIFMYFGLGCRNVSKILVPENYNFNFFFENIEHYNHLLKHNKYMNNHDYHRSIYLVNKTEHLDNGFLILKEDTGITSPIGVLYYQTYKENSDIDTYISANTENIQCVVTDDKSYPFKVINTGQSQFPDFMDYADGVDTMNFLLNL